MSSRSPGTPPGGPEPGAQAGPGGGGSGPDTDAPSPLASPAGAGARLRGGPAVSVTSPLALPALLRGAGPLAGALSLSPSQRAIAERSYDGPALVSGGPGTGKTTVAVHRAAYLASRLGAADGAGGPGVLLVTFSKYLAAQLRDRLARLDAAGRDRVEVVNIDALAARVVAAAEPGVPRHWLDEPRALDIWRSVLAEPGLPAGRVAGLSPEFLYDEWARVILGHAVNSRLEYYRVRRAGRGRPLNRAQRAVVWELAERFAKRLTEAHLWTFRQLIAYAVELASARPQLRAPHVVVDEAQDLSPAQLMLLRALAAPGPDDLFLASDPRQAIHAAVAPLAAAGIDVHGREERLTLSYRPTREILALATRLSSAGHAGPEVAAGGSAEHAPAGAGPGGDQGREQSLLRGAEPQLRGHATWAEELDAITGQVAAWLSPAAPDLRPLAPPPPGAAATGPQARPSIAVALPDLALAAEVERALAERGIAAAGIGADGPRRAGAVPGEGPGVVHVGTLPRFKGLEYQRVLIAGLSDRVPLTRPLLYMAATRARESLVIFWEGEPSHLLASETAGPRSMKNA